MRGKARARARATACLRMRRWQQRRAAMRVVLPVHTAAFAAMARRHTRGIYIAAAASASATARRHDVTCYLPPRASGVACHDKYYDIQICEAAVRALGAMFCGRSRVSENSEASALRRGEGHDERARVMARYEISPVRRHDDGETSASRAVADDDVTHDAHAHGGEAQTLFVTASVVAGVR